MATGSRLAGWGRVVFKSVSSRHLLLSEERGWQWQLWQVVRYDWVDTIGSIRWVGRSRKKKQKKGDGVVFFSQKFQKIFFFSHNNTLGLSHNTQKKQKSASGRSVDRSGGGVVCFGRSRSSKFSCSVHHFTRHSFIFFPGGRSVGRLVFFEDDDGRLGLGERSRPVGDGEFEALGDDYGREFIVVVVDFNGRAA